MVDREELCTVDQLRAVIGGQHRSVQVEEDRRRRSVVSSELLSVRSRDGRHPLDATPPAGPTRVDRPLVWPMSAGRSCRSSLARSTSPFGAFGDDQRHRDADPVTVGDECHQCLVFGLLQPGHREVHLDLDRSGIARSPRTADRSRRRVRRT